MGRPPKPIISKDRAARAALSVIDQEGIVGLSLQRVARELGVKAPSLYNHFQNKADLLAEVARLILREAVVPASKPDATWRDTVVDLCLAARRSILRHPHAAPLMLQFFPRHLMLAGYDHWITAYEEVPPELHMVIIEGTEKLTFGSALYAATCQARGIEPMPKFDPQKLPHLARAVDANPLNEEGTFVATLQRFLAAF